MASSMFVLGVTLKAFDQMSGVMKNATGPIDNLRKKVALLSQDLEKFGRSALADGLIAGGSLMKPVQAFSDLENASTRLQSTMLDSNGMTGAFEQVNKLAIKLGNQLPGTTADFLNMMQALKAQGITDESILNGVGESAANLAVLLKMPADEAAVFAAKMKVATGTADKDMLGLMDTIQRLNYMGVTSAEMMYAFGRSGGALKTFKIQGLEASKALAPVFGMLIKGGLSGETVGTGFASILNNMADRNKLGKTNKILAGAGIKLDFFDKKGNFKGAENMVAQLDKLKNLNPVALNAVLKELTGGGQDQQMLAQVVTNGLDGYKKAVADMEKQADLQKRVNMQLGTLANLWEAATGTFTNALAAFAETFAPEIKDMSNAFGALSERLQGFIKTHPVLAKWIGLAVGGFALAAIGLGALAIAFAGIGKYISLVMAMGPMILSMFTGLMTVARLAGTALMFTGKAVLFIGRALLLNPLGLAITAIAGGAYLIYRYWSPIKTFFSKLWSGVVDGFRSAVNAISSLMPEWLKDKTTGGNASFGKMSPKVPTVAGGKQQVDVGGKLEIIAPEGYSVRNVQANDSRVSMNVNNGQHMLSN